MRDAIATALLVAGVACQLLGVLGIVAMRDALDRLHYLGASIAATLCIAAAVLVSESFSVIGNKAIALAAFVLVVTPVLTHATARAIHERGEDR